MRGTIIRNISIGAIIFFGLFLILIQPSCNHMRPCVHPSRLPIWEPFGPTDINAVTGNGRLTVLLNAQGTITGFKWPNPGYYDHVKYFTTNRDKPLMGALPNEGVLTGIYYETDEGKKFEWLRSWSSEQEYHEPGLPGIGTCFVNDKIGIQVCFSDWVDPARDVFIRYIFADRDLGSPVKKAKLYVYANFNPIVSRIPYLPITDWCLECRSESTVNYDSEHDAMVQFKSGKDFSTGEFSSVAIAFGFSSPSSGHQAGKDIHAYKNFYNKADPFHSIDEGGLNNRDLSSGKVTSAMSVELNFSNISLSFKPAELLYFAVAGNKAEAVSLLDSVRAEKKKKAGFNTFQHWHNVYRDTLLPDTGDERVTEVTMASLMSLRLAFCSDSGAVVAGFSTQPPYGPDWPSNGAYINQAYMKAGWHDLALAHNRFYKRTQSTPDNPIRNVPHGNWPANMWADGVPAMPLIPWEIDETGFMVWNLVSYYEATGDRDYLDEIYPTVKLSADFLAEWRDPKTGLQKYSHEADNPRKTQTVFGAATTCLGLKFAMKAAKALDRKDDYMRWEKRYTELKMIILEIIYSPEKKCFVRPPFDSPRSECDFNGLYVIWPGELLPMEDPRLQGHAEALYEMMKPRIEGKVGRGSYESMAWLALAKAWKSNPEKLKLVQDAIAWNARVPATPTGHLGEVWLKTDSGIVAGESQPQSWNHALFYLAAIEAFGEKK